MGNTIRNRVELNRPHWNDWFNDRFWDRHPQRPPYYGRYPYSYWWRWGTAAGLTTWLGWGGVPIYYDDYDSYGWGPTDAYGTPAAYPQTEMDYAEQAQEIEEAAAGEPSGEEWMPLGVFALSKAKGTVVTPNMYLQLAINKEGLISGTLYNSTTDATYLVEGLTDRTTQVVAFKVADNENSPIVETGIYNLTQDEAVAQAYFSDGREEEIVLVRLPENE